MAESTRLTLGTRVSLAGSVVWSVLLVGVGFLPTYESETVSSAGVVTRSSQTLVSENGVGVLFLLAIPLLVSLAVTVLLARRSHRGLVVAWALMGVLGAFNVLALLTIGVLVVPVTAALLVACTLRTVTSPVGAAPAAG